MIIVVDAMSVRLDICHSLYNITDIHIAKPSITESAVMKIYFPYFFQFMLWHTVSVPKYSIYVLAQYLGLPNFSDRCDTVINSPSKLTA